MRLFFVIPTLDSFDRLDMLISSLRSQSYANWRLVFVDGPSGEDHRQWLDMCCLSEHRCSWVQQDVKCSGIYGAMNQGFSLAEPDEWILFWGSDDWAAGPHVMAEAVAAIETATLSPDLLICSGRYADLASRSLTRTTVFRSAGLLSSSAYRRSLFFGCTPPHQATLIGPGARRYLACYDTGFLLSADLDYFLRLSCFSDLLIQCIDLEFVHMANDGVSGRQTKLRLREVSRAYQSSFGFLWWFTFTARYLRRLFSWFACP